MTIVWGALGGVLCRHQICNLDEGTLDGSRLRYLTHNHTRVTTATLLLLDHLSSYLLRGMTSVVIRAQLQPHLSIYRHPAFEYIQH